MKESKSMAAAEMKALKKGHAPKQVLDHEKKEHAEMGYKKGGSIETKHTKFGMDDSEKGGRKPPHSAHKGPAETKGKGFGMKKGGPAKAKKAPMGPAGLAALAGPPPGAPPGPMGPGPGGMPGMKRGGRAHGDGVARKGHTKEREVKMASGGHVGRGDGVAQRGHTRCRVC